MSTAISSECTALTFRFRCRLFSECTAFTCLFRCHRRPEEKKQYLYFVVPSPHGEWLHVDTDVDFDVDLDLDVDAMIMAMVLITDCDITNNILRSCFKLSSLKSSRSQSSISRQKAM